MVQSADEEREKLRADVLAARDIIEKGLIPFVEMGLTIIYGQDWFEEENTRRKQLTKIRQLYRDKTNKVAWDYSDLLKTMSGGLWKPKDKNVGFEALFEDKGLASQRTRLRNDINDLVTLRDIIVGHNSLGTFTEREASEYFESAERVLEAAGAREAVAEIKKRYSTLKRRFGERNARDPDFRGGQLTTVLYDRYPDAYFMDFARAKKLWITGLNLRRIIYDRMGDIENVLTQDGNVQIILLDPLGSACKYAAIQDWGRGDDDSVESYITSVREAQKSFCELKSRLGTDKLEIRKIDYALGFGLDAMEFSSSNDGVIYVRFYPIKCRVDDRPIIRLSNKDEYWYGFYKEQFELHWTRATEWDCVDAGGIAR